MNDRFDEILIGMPLPGGMQQGRRIETIYAFFRYESIIRKPKENRRGFILACHLSRF
ncbi:hypothetical protein PMI16_02528 [Herbaspirillum sp. CF444]|nr:hypothetical protein PMI16_02528 [Herbaspirillum sp. CF444]